MSALKLWLESSRGVPVTQRGVHPLLLEALAALPCQPSMAEAAGIAQPGTGKPLCLGDLSIRQLVDVAIKPWTHADSKGMSYLEAVHAGVIPLPSHPLDETRSTLDLWWTCSQVEGTYQAWHHDRMHSDTARLVRSQPAILMGEDSPPTPPAPTSRDSLAPSSSSSLFTPMSGRSVPSALNSATGVHGTASMSGQTSTTGTQAGADVENNTVFYVVHSLDTNFHVFVQQIKRHYLGEVWARQRQSNVKAHDPWSSTNSYQQQQWCAQQQEPIYYFIDMLCLNFHADNIWESCLAQGCHRAIASCKAVVLITWPDLAQPGYLTRTWCLLCILIAAQLQKPVVMSLSLKDGCALSMDRCLELMEQYENSLSQFMLSSATTYNASDRDTLLQLIYSWLPDLETATNPNRTRSSLDAGAKGKPGPALSSTQLIEYILRARLRASLAERLFWGHLEHKHRSLHIVGAARLACESVAKYASLYSSGLSTASSTVASSTEKHISLGSVFNKAVSAVTTLLQPISHTQGGNTDTSNGKSINGTECGLTMDVDHMTPTLIAMLQEARRSPVVAQVPLQCTCKCPSCASTMLGEILPINHAPPESTGPGPRPRLAHHQGNSTTSKPSESIHPDLLVNFFPSWTPIPAASLLTRVEQLVNTTTCPALLCVCPRSSTSMTAARGPSSGAPLIATGASARGASRRMSAEMLPSPTSPWTGTAGPAIGNSTLSLTGLGRRLSGMNNGQPMRSVGNEGHSSNLICAISALSGQVASFSGVVERQGGSPRVSIDFPTSGRTALVSPSDRSRRQFSDVMHPPGTDVSSLNNDSNVRKVGVCTYAGTSLRDVLVPSSRRTSVSFAQDFNGSLAGHPRIGGRFSLNLPAVANGNLVMSPSSCISSPHTIKVPAAQEGGFQVIKGNRFGQQRSVPRFEDLVVGALKPN